MPRRLRRSHRLRLQTTTPTTTSTSVGSSNGEAREQRKLVEKIKLPKFQEEKELYDGKARKQQDVAGKIGKLEVEDVDCPAGVTTCPVIVAATAGSNLQGPKYFLVTSQGPGGHKYGPNAPRSGGAQVRINWKWKDWISCIEAIANGMRHSVRFMRWVVVGGRSEDRYR